MDFVGWYTTVTHDKLGISKWDARHQYLAYHEGHGGYLKRSYRREAWLLKVADRVDRQAKAYARQFKRCEKDLDKGWSLWPF